MANSNFEAFFLDLFIEHKPWDCEAWFNIPIPIDLVCNQNPTLASQYMFTSIDITFTAKKGEKGGKEISKDQSSSWENKERSNHFCLTKNNNESRETKFKHVWVFFGKVIWIHLWIKPKARKRQEEEKMLSRCVFPFFPTKVNFSEIRVTESGHEFKQFPPNKTGLRLADLSGLPIMCPLFWRENHLNSWPDSYLRKNWH